MSSRKLTLGPTRQTGRLPKMTPDRQAGRLWAQRRSLPAYISGESFAEAVTDLVVPDAAGRATMDTIVPGAQFWFGLLSRIGTLRAAGPKPAGAGN